MLTSASCGIDAGQYVVVGDHHLIDTEGTEASSVVTRVIQYPGYNFTYREHDLALVEVADDLLSNNNDNVQPICPPNALGDLTAEPVRVTGWKNIFAGTHAMEE